MFTLERGAVEKFELLARGGGEGGVGGERAMNESMGAIKTRYATKGEAVVFARVRGGGEEGGQHSWPEE